jgi:protoporphyrinogen oxidase
MRKREGAKEGASVVIIGAGPAGLTAAYELCKAGLSPLVLEQDATVGGLAKTVNHKGFRFDIGGHRFYTKVKAADDIWREVLPAEDFLRRPRLSRIYYGGKFFHYPLRASLMLLKMGVWEGGLILLSYLRAALSPRKAERTFEQWVTNRFGRRLYTTFFKSYTEKVWGIPCDEISAEWAAQRIQGLSLAVGYGWGAWRFHAARSARGHAPFKPDRDFYLKLLRAPLSRPGRAGAARLAALLFWTQLANTAGFFYQRRRSRKDAPRAGEPGA